MKHKYSLLCIAATLAFTLGAVAMVQAQDTNGEPVVTEVDSSQDIAPEEIATDEQVTSNDLGVEEPSLLPTSRFYFFKNWKRSVDLALTRDPIKKAEKRLQFANEKIAEAQIVIDEKLIDNPKAAEKATKIIEHAQADIEKASERIENIEDKSDEKVKKLVQKMAENQIKHQKVFDKIEKRFEDHDLIPDQFVGQMNDIKSKVAKATAQAMVNGVENPDQMREAFESAMNNQRGSELRHFRNVEILDRFEEHLPQEAQHAVQIAREKAQDLIAKVAEKEQEKFAQYVRHSVGDMTRHIKVLDDLRGSEGFSADQVENIEELKLHTAQRFEDQWDRIKDEQTRGRLIDHLQDGNPDNIRVIKQLKNFGDEDFEEEMKKADIKAAQKFKEKFKNDPEAIKTANTFERCRKNPDATCFEVMDSLEDNLTDEQKEFIHDIKVESAERVSEKIRLEGDDFEKRFATNSPQHIEVLQNLRDKLPPQAREGIERALEVQTRNINRQLRNNEDSEIFEKLRGQIEGQEDIKREIERRFGDVDEVFKERREEFERFEQDFARPMPPIPSPEAQEEFKRRLEQDGASADEIEQKLRQQFNNRSDNSQGQTPQGIQADRQDNAGHNNGAINNNRDEDGNRDFDRDRDNRDLNRGDQTDENRRLLQQRNEEEFKRAEERARQQNNGQGPDDALRKTFEDQLRNNQNGNLPPLPIPPGSNLKQPLTQ